MSDTPNKWALPEFGLVTHAHHNTYKKLKLNPELNPALKAHSTIPAAHAEGYDKGYSDGMMKATQEMNHQKQQLAALCQQLQSDSQAIQIEREDALCIFVKTLCEKVLYKELSTSSDVLKNVISKALKMIDNSGSEIRILCHPKLYENLHDDKFDSFTRVVFESNNQLNEHEFKIESDKQKICFNIDKLMCKLWEEILICNSQK
jgi:flagellar biosynthesis/type III secretory pathway protein FliH